MFFNIKVSFKRSLNPSCKAYISSAQQIKQEIVSHTAFHAKSTDYPSNTKPSPQKTPAKQNPNIFAASIGTSKVD